MTNPEVLVLKLIKSIKQGQRSINDLIDAPVNKGPSTLTRNCIEQKFTRRDLAYWSSNVPHIVKGVDQSPAS